jgi:hypothetical protein
VIGIVTSVDGPDAATVSSFTLRTAEGQTLEFEVGQLDLANGGQPAPHLRDHLRSGEPIELGYAVEDGRNVALRYVDAAAAEATPTN